MPKAHTILLTGAASGLGRELAISFPGQSHRLVMVDRDADGLAETVRQLGDIDACIKAACVDLTNSVHITELLDGLGDIQIDVLINNAGLQHVSRVDEFAEERWDVLIDVMLKAPFLLTKAVLPVMRAGGFGRIINIGSIHALVASPFKSAYVAAKHGLLGLAKVVALETGDVDITINTICPSYVRTPLVDRQIRDQAKAHGISEEDVIANIMLEPMPKKQFITVEEVAATVEFLISHAARNITGQTIVIDGGWTVR